GARADVVRSVHVRVVDDGVFELALGDRRLLREHVEPGADALLARLEERGLIDNLAARGVDEVRARLHRREHARADALLGLGREREVHADGVGAGDARFGGRRRGDAERLGLARLPDRPADDLHAEAVGALDDFLPDRAAAEYGERAAAEAAG